MIFSTSHPIQLPLKCLMLPSHSLLPQPVQIIIIILIKFKYNYARFIYINIKILIYLLKYTLKTTLQHPGYFMSYVLHKKAAYRLGSPRDKGDTVDLAVTLKNFYNTVEIQGTVRNLFDQHYKDPDNFSRLTGPKVPGDFTQEGISRFCNRPIQILKSKRCLPYGGFASLCFCDIFEYLMGVKL